MREHINKNIEGEAGVAIDGDYCGKCMVCPSVCPFDAISTDEKTAEIKLDIEKCQVCGICYITCPASAIGTVYYDVDSLITYVDRSMREKGADKLVLVCRGAGPLQKGIMDELEKRHIDHFVSMSLPCVGRVPPEFLLKALSLGIRKLVTIPCEDKYCRFKEGSKIGTRRVLLTQALLSQLGFEKNTLTVIKRSVKAHVDAYRCIGCGDCTYVCPNDAAKIMALGVAQIDLDACSGCGVCVAVCPALAIKLDGFEHEAISKVIHEYSSSVKENRFKKAKPAILVFCCQWSEFSGLDVPQTLNVENVAFLGLPCAGRVDTLHVIEALQSGFDGVLIAACGKDECKLEQGNEKAERRINSLKKVLAQLNLEDRLEMCFVSPRTVGQLDKNIKSFIEKMSSLFERLDEGSISK